MKTVLKDYFLPSDYVNRFTDITSDYLKSHDKTAVMIDLDNTLVAFDDPDINDEVIEWIETLHEGGIQVLILSNGRKNRVERFCKDSDLKYIHTARKPAMRGFHKGITELGVKKKAVVMIGDQVMTDVLGANRTGIDSILVLPVKEKDAFVTKFNRRMERRIMKWIADEDLLNWRNY